VIGGDDNYWLGWNKSPVSIKFNFDVSRHFKTIQIYTMSNEYQSIHIKFDDNPSIKHHPSPIESSLSTIFVDTIQLIKYGNIFIGKQVEIIIEFNNELLLLTEITFDNEPAISMNTTIGINNTTTHCPIGKKKKKEIFLSNYKYFYLVMNNTSTYESSSLAIFTFEWLTILIGSILSLCFLLFLLLFLYRFRCRSHHRLRQNSNLYYKCSQMTTTTSGSCVSTSSDNDGNTLSVKKIPNHFLISNNYDDITSEQQSMGSYIYPITSTTSLLQTTPPSSLFKGEQYAVIDGNYSSNIYKQWSTNNVKIKINHYLVLFIYFYLLDISLCFIRYWTN
jgi:hypothetical protein